MTSDAPGMQVVLPGVMRYSEPVAGAHLSGPAEVPSARIDYIRYAQQRKYNLRGNFFSYIISAAQCRSRRALRPIKQAVDRAPPVALFRLRAFHSHCEETP